jgi:hypothetical protein
MYDVCQECLDEDRKYRNDEYNSFQRCDWCKQEKQFVMPHRDYEEGMGGPVYDVCRDCREKETAQILAEEQYREWSDPYYYEDYRDDDFDDDAEADRLAEDAEYERLLASDPYFDKYGFSKREWANRKGRGETSPFLYKTHINRRRFKKAGRKEAVGKTLGKRELKVLTACNKAFSQMDHNDAILVWQALI